LHGFGDRLIVRLSTTGHLAARLRDGGLVMMPNLSKEANI